MKFCDELNNYMQILDCSPKDLSEISGLSPTLISRYLNDKRTPRTQSEYLDKIIETLYAIANQKDIILSKDEISNTLRKSITFSDIDSIDFMHNFNTLLTELKINTIDLAKSISYDVSFISRIKNGSRKPSNLDDFIDKIADYVVETYHDEKKQLVASLLNCSLDDLKNNEDYKRIFVKWITTSQHENNEGIIQNFLSKLDSFNLNDYISTDFNKIKVPTSPVILRNSKTFYGMEGRKQAEAEFLKTTLIAKSKEPIFFYSNFPIAETSKDEEFKNKWVLAMAMVLKKGLHLNMIHDVDRPLNEMLLGLENWIPIYMTGSISPYYFKDYPSGIFSMSHCTSGSCVLSGECMQDNLENSKFYITTKKEELEFYKEKSKYMLSKAKPLMTIFKEEDSDKFEEFMKKEKDNSNIEKIQKNTFKNIDFYINKNKWIMINKLTAPEMHFVIYHSKLRNAIENFLI